MTTDVDVALLVRSICRLIASLKPPTLDATALAAFNGVSLALMGPTLLQASDGHIFSGETSTRVLATLLVS